LHFVTDGVEALDFLHRRGKYTEVPRPNLILLDVNMPRLGGLETLSAIKSDPELYVIPVIMLSTSASPRDIQESYQARATCYLEKPTNLDRSVKLVQAIENFWMQFALLPACDEDASSGSQPKDSNKQRPTRGERGTKAGNRIASTPAEAGSRAMWDDSQTRKIETTIRKSGCEEHDRLLDEFGATVSELLALHEAQFAAIVDEDIECTRFDLLIHMVNEKKHRAKYAYLRHVEAHGCTDQNDARQTGA
jgi:CheY-like chemotaxis protein